jgi:hypothetical protein
MREELLQLMYSLKRDNGYPAPDHELADSILEWHRKGLIRELETAIGKEALNIYNNGGFTVKLEWLEHRIQELKKMLQV